MVQRIGMAGVAALLALAATPARAQAGAADRDARIEALQAQLDRLQAELAALRGGTGTAPAQSGEVPAASPAVPTSAAAAGTVTLAGGPSASTSATATPTGARSRIFGAAVPTSAGVSRIDAGHPAIATADGRFTASLLGVMQFDVADYFQHSPGPLTTDFRRAGAASDTARALELGDGSTFRRARIGIAGKAFGDFEYTVLFDFGGAGEEDSGHVQELWLQYSGWKPAHLRVGAFAPFIGLEDAGSTNGMLFLERPAASDIARSLAGGDYREGGQVAFTGKQWFASAAVTGRTVNTAGSSTVQPYRDPLGFVGRAGLVPIKTQDDIVHLGVHGSYLAHPADTAGPNPAAGVAISPVEYRERPELRVDGTRLIDTAAIDALHAYSAGAEAAVEHRNFLLQGEYERLGIDRRTPNVADPHFDGFYVEGSWVITGQRRRYNDGNYAFDGPAVEGSFDPKHGNWGAWELALRYSQIDLNYAQGAIGTVPIAAAVRGGDQAIGTAGVNWYLNSIARVMVDYQHVVIHRLSPNAATYQTPAGAEVGQTYSAVATRFQLAF